MLIPSFFIRNITPIIITNYLSKVSPVTQLYRMSALRSGLHYLLPPLCGFGLLD